MLDSRVGTTFVLAVVAWTVAVGLMVAGTVADSDHLSRWAMFVVVGASLLTVRQLLANHRDHLKEAFAWGREYERSGPDAKLHKIR